MGWEDSDPQDLSATPPERPGGGPIFAWRARVLWLFGGVLLTLSAILTAGVVAVYPDSAPLLIAFAAVQAGGAIACLAARAALGSGQIWAASPSVLLGWSLIIGGIARAAGAIATGSILIPLEPLVGLWLLVSRDRPRLRLGRPSDWRTVALGAMVVALAVTSVVPYLPADTPLLSALGSGPDALDASLTVECPDPAVAWSSTPVALTYHWRGIDLGGVVKDRITLEVSGPSAGSLAWDDFENNGLQIPDGEFSTRLAFELSPTVPYRTVSASLVPVDGAAISAFTVTARLEHAGRWEVVQTRSCGG